MDLQKFDQICDEYETGLKAGKTVRIEDFVERVDQQERSQLLRELLQVDLEYDPTNAEDRSADLQKRFPQQSEFIMTVISQNSQNSRIQRIGDYEIIEEIGHGGMGTVYKAKHALLNQFVAIKVLSQTLLGDPNAVGRFRREMQLIGGLDHPNVVRALNAGETEDAHYLVMEFVDGVTIQNFIEHLKTKELPKISFGAACEVVRQAAMGLQNVHELHLIHRDIKPANLMVDQRGTVKILDLGLGKFQTGQIAETSNTSLTMAGMTLGTVDYISPEQCENAGNVDIRGDLYSLGCTLYYLLTGKAVYSGTEYDTTRKKLFGHLVGNIPDLHTVLPNVPDGLNETFRRMIAKDPKDRFQTPLEFAEAVQVYASFDEFTDALRHAGALNTKNRPSSSQTISVRTSPPFNKWRFIAALVLIHLVLFGGIFGGVYWYVSRKAVPFAPTEDSASITPQSEISSETKNTITTDLALMPGLSGDWWFNEKPWYLPEVRELLVRKIEEAADYTSVFGTNPNVLYDVNVVNVQKFLWDLLEKYKSEIPPQRFELIATLKKTSGMADKPAIEKTYSTLVEQENQALGEESGSGTQRHTLALIEHRLAVLKGDRELAKRALEHYELALEQYRKEAKNGSMLSNRLIFLCLSDTARIEYLATGDYHKAVRRFESIAQQRKADDHLGTLFSAEYRATYGLMCAEAGQFNSTYFNDTIFVQAKTSFVRANENNRNHPLAAYIAECYADSLLNQWKIADAEKQFTEALSVRMANFRVMHDLWSFERMLFNSNGRASCFRFAGNSQRAMDEYRGILKRIENGELRDYFPRPDDLLLNSKSIPQHYVQMIQYQTALTKERLADCTLFGGAASGLGKDRLSEAVKLYGDSELLYQMSESDARESAYKQVIVLLLLNRSDEAKKKLDGLAQKPGSEFVRQVAEGMYEYHSGNQNQPDRNTGKSDERKTKLRQFLQQFTLPYNPAATWAEHRETLELRLFCAEYLESEAWRENNPQSMNWDLSALRAMLPFFLDKRDAKPYIRRACNLVVRTWVKLYHTQNDPTLKEGIMRWIVQLLVEMRWKPDETQKLARLSPVKDFSLETMLVFFLTDDPDDGFVIFYPQDSRLARFFPLRLTRREIKSGHWDHQSSGKTLPPELVKLIEEERKAGRSVKNCWNDEATYSRPEDALTDADFPFEQAKSQK
ncbi:hypothetical protein FACS189443_0610 [Planctomycetales bacterium]|nr:hypothetical protein FACS189443_0610 [Planctomycetales bacterium]